MKLRKIEYHNYFPIYGQCISGRIAYWEKMGVALGIVHEIKTLMRNRDISTKRYITKYDGLDPEVSMSHPGIDRGLYPRPITYMLGLNLNF